MPSMGKLTQLVLPFTNKGLVQRIDPGMLDQGQYYSLLNMMSTQEGAIVSRLGSQNVSPSLAPGLTSNVTTYLLHSLAKLRVSATDTLNPRYLGWGSKIYKTTPDASGIYSTQTDVATDAAGSNYLTLDYKWQAAQYSAGQQATPNIYFASPNAMMRDGQTVEALQQWGVRTPGYPVAAISGYGGYDETSNSVKNLWSPTAASGTFPATRVRVVASGVSLIQAYSSFVGYYRITYGASIYGGPSTNYPSYEMFLTTPAATTSPVACLGGNVAAGTMDIWWPFNTTIAVGTTFFHEMRAPVTSSIGIASDVMTLFPAAYDLSYSDPVFPASADSNELNGYQTDDFLNMSVWVQGAEYLVDISVQLYVIPAGAGAGTDYYIKNFVVSPAAGAIQATTTVSLNTIQSAAQTLSANINQGVFGGSDPSLIGSQAYDLPGNLGADANTLLGQMAPGQLTPSAAGTGTLGAYFDLTWRKSEMIPVGRAGQPGYNWKHVSVGAVTVRASTSSATIIMRAGPCWSRGGYGLDTTIPGSFPYDYLVAFRNPGTNHIGNPSVPMIQENYLGIQAPMRRCGAGLIVRGFSSTLTGGPQLSHYTGPGSLAIYRRGGQFSDGLYRLCQYASNPGSVFTFVPDTVPDYQLLGAPILEFDNDQPVTSTLPQAFTGIVLAVVGTTVAVGGQLNTVTLAISSGIESFLSSFRKYSLMHFDVGAKAEDVIIEDFNTTTPSVTFYAQRTHVQTSTGIPFEVDAVRGQPCDLVVQAHDSLFLAGDELNPHILYRSKTGRPESFPVINDVTKQSHQIPVGTPSNPIRGICEFNGDIVCLNLNSIYIVKIWQGVMQAPLETPAQRGCVVKRCFAKGVNSIYYLSSDGVYEWSGGVAVKISEQIDWVFRDRTVNGIAPMSRAQATLDKAIMFYHQNQLYLTIATTTQGYRTFRYDTLLNRWNSDAILDNSSNVLTYTSAMEEQDTNRLYAAIQPAVAGQAIKFSTLWTEGTTGTTDGYSLAPGLDGTYVYYEVVTPFITGGAPSVQKLFVDAVLEYSAPSAGLVVEPLYDFAVPPTAISGAESFTLSGDQGSATIASGSTVAVRLSGPTWGPELIGTNIMVGNSAASSYASRTILSVTSPGTLGVDSAWPFNNATGESFLFRRQRTPLPLNQATLSATTVTNGREAYAVAFRITPTTPVFNRVPTTLYSLTLNYIPLDQVQRARITDWSDLGYPYDKQLDVLSIEYELPTGISTPVEVWLDVMQGIAGATTLNQGVAKFQLGTGTLGSNVRHKDSIPIANISGGTKIICKLARLRPVVQAMNFLVYEWDIQHKKYPPDIVKFTEPNDAGSPWDKYFTQLLLEVDTGGVTATAAVKIDGTLQQTVTFASTEEDRIRNFTLKRGLTGKVYSLEMSSGASGKFQLFNHKVITEPADKGPVVHSHDWDDRGWPYDKRFYHVTFEYEVSADTTMELLGLSGVAGANQSISTIAVFTMPNSSGQRRDEQFRFPDNSIYKMVRFQPATNNPDTTAKIYNPDFNFEKYPPDIVPFTEPSNYGSPYLKYFQQLVLDVDTAGTAGTSIVEIDGTAACTFSVTTTPTARMANLTLPGNNIGRMARLLNTAAGSAGAKFQLFSHSFVTLPADKGPVLHTFDWEDLGHPYDKRFYEATVEADVRAGLTQILFVTGITGVSGAQNTVSMGAITISGVAGRIKRQFAFPTAASSSIAKMIRIAPDPSNPLDPTTRVYKPDYQYDRYPPDVVACTEPKDYGSPFLKYFQQLVLDVDTGSSAASVVVEIDGSAAYTFSPIITTANNRVVNLTLPGNNIGRMARIIANPGVKFQLFSHDFVTLPADKGAVLHTFDWDDCGYPYDKHFEEMTIEFDISNTATQALIIAGVTGVLGAQDTVSMGAITISSVIGRVKRQFAFPTAFATSVAKMIRVYPDANNPLVSSTRVYKPEFQFQKYPPDIVRTTEYSDFGAPYQKYFQQLLLDVDTGSGAAQVIVEVDGASVQTFSAITTDATTRKVNLTMLGGIAGKMARIRATPAGSSGAKFQLFSCDFVTLPADKGPVLHTYDWSDLEHPYDKRMYQVVFEYEVSGTVVMQLQGVAGVDGGETTNSTIALITLTPTGAARKKQQYRFPDNSIYKLIRLAPVTNYPATSDKIYKPDWQFEKYPPDIVPFTEPNNYGSPYLKYFQQLVLDVDTGNSAASVIVEIDGSAAQTLSVTTTSLARNKTLTLSPVLTGRMGRILATPGVGTGAKFQLFSATFVTLPADKGPVVHSFDYDDLGWPYDKRLKEVTIEYDTGGVATTVYMDTIVGTQGRQHVTQAQTFALGGSGRAQQTFPIDDGQIVKMVKLYPASTTVDLREWKYKFDFERMPADISFFTEWELLDSPCEKILRSVTIDCDTGNVPATVEVQADGETKYSFSITGSTIDRISINTLPSDLIGKMFRLKFTPGTGGKAQVFSHKFDRILEPCYVTHWDSYEQSFGSNGFKFIKQVWLEYLCASPITFSIYRDDGQLFYQVTLPTHKYRNVQRFYLPKEFSAGGRNAYNKSKIYRFVIDSTTTDAFKFYRDASRVETRNLGTDQREGLLQSYLFSQMPIPV